MNIKILIMRFNHDYLILELIKGDAIGWNPHPIKYFFILFGQNLEKKAGIN